MGYKFPLGLFLLGLALLGGARAVAPYANHAGGGWQLIFQLAALPVLFVGIMATFLGGWELLLAASPKLRRYIERLESDPKYKSRLRQSFEKMNKARLAKRRKRGG